MAKEYWLKFETGNPVTLGLAPTFTVFKSWTGGNVTPPGITQQFASVGLYRFEYSPSFSIVFVVDGATTSLTSANRYIVGSLDPLDSVDERLQEVGSTLIAVGNTAIALGTTGIALGTTSVAQNATLLLYGATILTTVVAIRDTQLPALSSQIAGVGNTGAALGNTSIANLVDLQTRIGTTASSFGSTGTDPGDLYGFLKRAQEFNEGNSSFDKSTGIWQIKTRGSTLIQQKTLTDSASTVTKA